MVAGRVAALRGPLRRQYFCLLQHGLHRLVSRWSRPAPHRGRTPARGRPSPLRTVLSRRPARGYAAAPAPTDQPVPPPCRQPISTGRRRASCRSRFRTSPSSRRWLRPRRCSAITDSGEFGGRLRPMKANGCLRRPQTAPTHAPRVARRRGGCPTASAHLGGPAPVPAIAGHRHRWRPEPGEECGALCGAKRRRIGQLGVVWCSEHRRRR